MYNKYKIPNSVKFLDYNDDFDDIQDKASFLLQNELNEEDNFMAKTKMGRALNSIKNLDEEDPNGKQKIGRIMQDLKNTDASKHLLDLIVGLKMFF